jgi:predicted GIY-YIG superfamily endonuclease
MEKAWFCYCLESEDKKTYIGSTVNVDRRLRQHNKEITGGAKATARSTGWKRICCITGFPNGRSALQFEWKWKRVSKEMKGSPLEKRLTALEFMLNSEKTTANSQPFSSYDAPLCLYLEDPSCFVMKEKELKYAIVTDMEN